MVKNNLCFTYVDPRHDEGNLAAGVLRQVAVSVQLVPSELWWRKERERKKIRHWKYPFI